MLTLHKFEGPIQGWTVNWLTENGWRFEPYHERGDMLQNAYIVFLKCSSRYPEVEPRHFMALYQTAWKRYCINLAKKVSSDRRCQSASRLDRESHETFEVEPVGDLDNYGYVSLMLKQAPREVTLVLTLMLNAPSELLDMAMSAMKAKNRRVSDESMICSMLGLPEGSTPLQTVRDYFRTQS